VVQKNLSNIEKFCYTVGFSSEKQNELEEIIKIYKLPRETRSKLEVKKLILNLLRKNREIELKKLMFMLNVKYDFIKELLNELSKEDMVKKFIKGKRVFIKIS
jgi:predicted transcriptional regulator